MKKLGIVAAQLTISGALSLLIGCASTVESLQEAPSAGTWLFSRDYNTTSECLLKAINYVTRGQPGLDMGDRFVGASHIEMVEPGRVNYIVQDVVIILLRVENIGPSAAKATAYIKSTLLRRSLPEMARTAAKECGGVAQES